MTALIKSIKVIGLCVSDNKDATNKKVTYKSSDPKIASVDKNGKITAKKKGKVKITATSKENKKIKAECEVKVK